MSIRWKAIDDEQPASFCVRPMCRVHVPGSRAKVKVSFSHSPRSEHCHIDVAYINIAGTFEFMATVIDGFSRLVVAWDIAAQIGEKEIEILLQQGRERFPGAFRGSSLTTVRRTLSPDDQEPVHPSFDATDDQGHKEDGTQLCGTLYYAATPLCHRLCDTTGHAGRPPKGDS
jgi:hypothetical protein